MCPHVLAVSEEMRVRLGKSPQCLTTGQLECVGKGTPRAVDVSEQLFVHAGEG
jgi:hypothetical protein